MACNLNVLHPPDHQYNNAASGVFDFSISCRYVPGVTDTILHQLTQITLDKF